MKHIIEIPCQIGDIFYFSDETRFFDYSTRKTLEGYYPFQVTSISWSINKKNEVKSAVRLCIVVDGKTHDVQRTVRFEDFGAILFSTAELAQQHNWSSSIKGGIE